MAKLVGEEVAPLNIDSSKLGNKPSAFDGVFTSRKLVIVTCLAFFVLFFFSLSGGPSDAEIHQTVRESGGSVTKHEYDGGKGTEGDVTSTKPITPAETTPAASSSPTTVNDLMESFKSAYQHLDVRLTERYGVYYRPIFFDGATPRGRFVFEAGDGTSTLSQDRFRRKLKLKVLQYLTTGSAHFIWATGGHSATAGHGNFYHQSYTAYLEEAAQPVFEAMGMNFTGRNYAMGGTAAGPESALCSEEIYGQDIDALVWDFGMTDGHDWWLETLYHLRAGLNKGRPINFAYHAGKKGARNKVVSEIEAMGLGALISNENLLTETMKGVPDSFGITDEQIKELPWFVRNFKCNNAIENGEPYCKDQKFDNSKCAGRKFKTSWHPGWRWQSVMGNLAAFYVLENLGFALAELADVQDLDSELNILKRQEDADYAQFSSAPLPQSLEPLVKQFQGKNGLDPDLLIRNRNFCHTGRLPAEIRHKGILTESSKIGFRSYDTGMELKDARNSPGGAESEVMTLVYNQEDRQTCDIPTNMDYKDYFFVSKEQGLRKLTLPNDSELREYGDGRPLAGHLMGCFTLCSWGKCPPGVLVLEDFFAGKFEMQVNNQKVHNLTKVHDCMLLRNEQGYKWDLNDNGRFDIAASISNTAEARSYLRFSAFILW